MDLKELVYSLELEKNSNEIEYLKKQNNFLEETILKVLEVCKEKDEEIIRLKSETDNKIENIVVEREDFSIEDVMSFIDSVDDETYTLKDINLYGFSKGSLHNVISELGIEKTKVKGVVYLSKEDKEKVEEYYREKRKSINRLEAKR